MNKKIKLNHRQNIVRQLKKSKERRHLRAQQIEERKRMGARGKHRGAPMDFFGAQHLATLTLQEEGLANEIKIITDDPRPINQAYLEEYKNKFLNEAKKSHDANIQNQYAEYLRLYTDYQECLKKLQRARKANDANTEWQTWDPEGLSEKTARSELLKISNDLLLGALPSIPVAGPVFSIIIMGYNQLKTSLEELRDASLNVLTGTRQMSSVGRIAGVVIGAVIGAAVVGGIAAAGGSAIPFVGTALAGTVGIIAGAIIGASFGGPLGVSAFKLLASGNKTFKDERDYQMEYAHLRQLRKLYGFDEKIILNMHAYLSNQIKLLPKSESKALRNLRKNALELGKEKSLGILCKYFLSQEKLLRSGLYDLSYESTLNQKERSELLIQRARILQENPKLSEKITLLYEMEAELAKLESQREGIGNRISKKETNLRFEITKLIQESKDVYHIDRLLKKNQQKQFEIADKRFEMTRERDLVLDILKEYKTPTEQYHPILFGKKPIHVYNQMRKIEANGVLLMPEDEIGNLFVERTGPKIGKRARENFSESITALDVRSFGESEGSYPYAVNINNQELKKKKADYYHDLVNHGFQYAKEVGAIAQMKKFDKSLSEIYKLSEESKRILTELASADQADAIKINNKLNENIFLLQKQKQLFKNDKKIIQDIDYNLLQLTDVQHFLQYSSLIFTKKRSELALPEDSAVRDILPFTVIERAPSEAMRRSQAIFSEPKSSNKPPKGLPPRKKTSHPLPRGKRPKK